MVDSDTDDNLQRLFLENNWTDKLPIVLPTEKRVAEMLAHTSRKPDEVAGHIRSNQFRQHWEFTVEKVAVNAVMAGASPEYFPVILALAASGVSARGSTTSSMAAMVVVNGPIRNEIGMNSGTGAMAPYNHANATIGRAYGLLSQNLQGGSIPGDSYMGSQGNGYAYGTVTFAENEERSPWTPFHVQHGFKPTDSTVSIFHRLPLDGVHPRRAREILARACAQHAARHGRAQRADVSARPDRGARSTSTAAASTPRKKSSNGFTKTR